MLLMHPTPQPSTKQYYMVGGMANLCWEVHVWASALAIARSLWCKGGWLVRCSRCSHWGYVHPFGTRLVTGHRDLVGDHCRASCFSLNRIRCKEYVFVALYPCVHVLSIVVNVDTWCIYVCRTMYSEWLITIKFPRVALCKHAQDFLINQTWKQWAASWLLSYCG